MVRVSRGASLWTGFILEDNGVVLTSSSRLGTSPLVNVQLPNGQVLEGWVQGRYDPLGIAVITVPASASSSLLPVRKSESLAATGDVLITLGYESNSVIASQTSVSAVRGDVAAGTYFLQTLTGTIPGSEGGPVVSLTGDVIGMLIDDATAGRAGVTSVGAGFAVPMRLVTAMLDNLKAGLSNIYVSSSGGGSSGGVPPPLPAIVTGTVVFNGAIPAEGSAVYVRLTATIQPEIWLATKITGGTGAFQALVAPSNSSYSGGTIEFWMNGVKAGQTVTYLAGLQSTVALAFGSAIASP
jgi:S1-C subfamily serine protease